MQNTNTPKPEEVEHILHNARLRDELEPFLDESVQMVDVRRMPTVMENEFLESMLAWERAPVLPISQWFDSELILPHPDKIDEEQLADILMATIHQLYAKRVVLDFTDHLCDRQLYCLIYRDILPSPEKKIDLPKNFLHWHCLDTTEDPHLWLRYYATDEERRMWSSETGQKPPAAEPAPYPRKMPRKAN